MEICEKLKKARAGAGMTQEQVAEKIGVSRQTISNWENGKTLPDVMNAIKLSDLYQVTLDELLKGDSKMMDKIKKRHRYCEKQSVLNKSCMDFDHSLVLIFSLV